MNRNLGGGMRIVRKMLFFVVSMAAGLAQADTATIGANQDNYVSWGTTAGDQANTVQGSSGTANYLTVRGQNTAANSSKAWIRFDLSSQEYDANASATVTVAAMTFLNLTNTTIRLYVLKTGFTPGAGVLGTGWTEGSIMWSNAPGNIYTNASPIAPSAKECDLTTTVLMGSISNSTPGAGTAYAFAITNRLGDFIQVDKSVTVMLTSKESTGGDKFASKEHATAAWRPKLTYTLSPAQGTLIQFK